MKVQKLQRTRDDLVLCEHPSIESNLGSSGGQEGEGKGKRKEEEFGKRRRKKTNWPK
jgi:hypothetical protein